ncbi:hypothetical protein GCM10023237_03290 [Streptomyces coeruleoprunus]
MQQRTGRLLVGGPPVLLRGVLLTGPGAGLRRRGCVRHAVAQLPQLGAQVVELMHREVAQGALPAALRVVLVAPGVAAYGVHLSAQTAGLRDEGVHSAALGRLLAGTVREQMGRHVVLRYRRGGQGLTARTGIRLLHRWRHLVRDLATLDTVVLLAYAKGRSGSGQAGRNPTIRRLHTHPSPLNAQVPTRTPVHGAPVRERAGIPSPTGVNMPWQC